MQRSLLSKKTVSIHSPLADRMRPHVLEDFVGQEHIIAQGKALHSLITADTIPSIIFWGPPGVGKTTLARIIAERTQAEFVALNAIECGVKDIRAIVKQADYYQETSAKKTIVFIDEIHRFNKAQQDALLPFVERGTITLIGATTENPSFEVNNALLSRTRVFTLEPLTPSHIVTILKRAISDPKNGLGNKKITIAEDTLELLGHMSNGDSRTALNTLEVAVMSTQPDAAEKTITLSDASIKEAMQKTNLLYDKTGEEHYNIISALHKSMRGNDPDASLYWLTRMLEGGEDPLYIARRVIRFASEDIGIANSQALVQAIAAYHACHYIGMPECSVNLAQAVVYMAKSQKSNELYRAYLDAQKDVAENLNEPVPLHLRNAPTKLMKNLNYGKGYKYTPEFETQEDAEQQYMPDSLKDKKYFE